MFEFLLNCLKPIAGMSVFMTILYAGIVIGLNKLDGVDDRPLFGRTNATVQKISDQELAEWSLKISAGDMQ